MNEWLTANKIIATGKQAISPIINDQTHKMNLFPILVRRIDFIREKESDRILSRFPFLVLADEEKELIKSKILLIAEIARNYFYQSITSGIMAWKKRLQIYLERGALPYPLYRCACKVLNCTIQKQDTEALPFESARGKRYVIPTKLSPTLAYLCGVVNGDGHLHRHWLRVVDETKEHIELISKLFRNMFNDTGKIFLTGNAWNVELRSSSAVRLFNFLTDHTIQGAKYDSLREPLLFQRLGVPYRNLYWRGAMDADGTYKNHISFGSASMQYVKDFQLFLQSINIPSKFYRMKNGAYLLTIPIDFKLSFAKQIGALNPKKKQDFCKLLQRKSIVFNGLIEKNITSSGYFDFTKMLPLHITGLASTLREFRKEKTYNAIEQELSVTRGQYYHYEHGTRAIPFELLFRLFNIQSNNSNTLMQKLDSQENSLYFQSSTSKPIRLPLKPTSDVILLMSHLQPLSNWTKVIQPTQEIKEKILDIFGIIANSNQIRGNVLLRFLLTFGDYTIINANDFFSDDIL